VPASKATICCIALFSWALLTPSASVATDNSAPPPELRYALLVGCTKYPNNAAINELYGPANDVPMWQRLLTNPQGFAFPDSNVVQLLGWPDQESRRPTYANIKSAFENLITKSKPGVQIFILLSGHGTQQPIPDDQDPLDPSNPEPDGLDEVFLSADASLSAEGLQNGIRDDQIGRWLDEIRNRGASVWIVFDCCHSGTMTRAGDEGEEISRYVRPEKLGISPEKLDQATRRAAAAVDAAKKGGREIPGTTTIRPSREGEGSLIAFYAAQSFETAPELPLPEGVPHTREYYFGLLSYSLFQSLEQARSPVTYRTLTRMLASRYRSLRGTREPTPFAEGDLDREVFGLLRWPGQASMLLEKDKDKLRLTAGELRGVTTGSLLAVHPPAGDSREPNIVLGYIRVDFAGANQSAVSPCSYKDQPAFNAKDIPELARCEIVSRDFGDMQIKLFSKEAVVREVLGAAPQDLRDMARLVAEKDEQNAQWRLELVDRGRAKEEFGITLTGPRILLLQGDGLKRLSSSETQPSATLRQDGQPALRKVFGAYLPENKALASSLERDLPKIFKWQNVWRVADQASALNDRETHGLKFEVALLASEEDKTGGVLLREPVLHDGQAVEFRVKNEGTEDLWVTILYLDANLGIHAGDYTPGVIRRGDSMRPLRASMSVEGASTGYEGMVVLAIPMSIQKDEPDFAFLEQEPLGVVTKSVRDAPKAMTTPFQKLMTSAAFGGGTRDMQKHVSSTPAILSSSWILLP
jgi:hypothetical protein